MNRNAEGLYRKRDAKGGIKEAANDQKELVTSWQQPFGLGLNTCLHSEPELSAFKPFNPTASLSFFERPTPISEVPASSAALVSVPSGSTLAFQIVKTDPICKAS